MTLRLRWVQHSAVLSILLLVRMAAASSRAQQPAESFTPKLTQYAHTAWRLQDGAFSGMPIRLGQTSDGYLWVGTETGLVRFDGAQFVPWGTDTEPVVAMAASNDGSLWVGRRTGLSRVGGPRPGPLPKIPLNINGVDLDSHGTVWLARKSGPAGSGQLCKVEGDGFRCFGPADGMPCFLQQAIAEDTSRDVWVLGDRNLCNLSRPGESFPLPGSTTSPSNKVIDGTMVPSDHGGLVIGLEDPVGGALLQEFNAGQWRPLHVPGLDSTAHSLEVMLKAADGTLWIGTMGQGLYHVHGAEADHFGSADGLSGDSIFDLFQDHEGSIWVATSTGVDRLHVPKVVAFTTREGLTSDNLTSVMAAPNADLWIGTTNGLFRMHDMQFSAVQPAPDKAAPSVSAMLDDHRGSVWFGIDADLIRYTTGRFTTIKKPDGSAVGRIRNIVEDSEGAVWLVLIGDAPQLFRLSPAGVLEEIRPPSTPFLDIAADPKDGVWGVTTDYKLVHMSAGKSSAAIDTPIHGRVVFKADEDGSLLFTTDRGLMRWNGSSWALLSSANGLPCSDVWGSVATQPNGWWMSMACGLAFIPRQQVNLWERNPVSTISIKMLDAIDGAHPASDIAVGQDGRVWLSGHAGLQMYDPHMLITNTLTPPVHISQFVADNVPYYPSTNPRVPVLTRNIQIDYTGLSFVTPQKVRFRYRLSGVDNDWQDAGARRQAFYTNLRPGTYTFQVVASNNDGVWNMQGDTVQFTLPPTFYQTRWFLAVEIAAVLLAVFLFFRFRLTRATDLLSARHRERLAERDRIARELHDTLLQGLHGLMLRLHTGVEMIPPAEPAKVVLYDAMDRANLVITEGRSSVQNLRSASSESPSLSAELERVAAEQRIDSSPTCAVVSTGPDRPIDPVAYHELFAIGREAMINAFRHADATSITVELSFSRRQFRLVCRDDGCGVPQSTRTAGRATGRFGLVGMQERARKLMGELTVVPAQPQGTLVTLAVPARMVYHRRKWGFFTKWVRQHTV